MNIPLWKSPVRLRVFAFGLGLSLAGSLPLLALSQAKPAHNAGTTKTARAGVGATPKALHEVTVQSIQPGRKTPGASQDEGIAPRQLGREGVGPQGPRKPRESRLQRGRSWNGDLRDLPQTRPLKTERPEREGPDPAPSTLVVDGATQAVSTSAPQPSVPDRNAPAPATFANFDGLDFATWGNGHPPDTNGDVGPTYYIQSINTSLGIFNKSDGSLVSAFTFNTFMSQGNFGNLCDTNNFGDPVILYDTFEDRWIVTDFAFQLSGGAVVNPPGSFECFAVSKTGDPVSGGWNFYSTQTTDFLNDYPKLGVWPDGIYMAANMFGFASGGSYSSPRVWALNKAQMYAGAPTVQVVSFDGPPADFTLLPSNARLQTGTPPAGTPNYFVSTWQFLNAITVYKFHVDWKSIGLSTFTGPDTPLAATSWPNATVPNAPSQGGNTLDVSQIRAMMQNQYTNLGGAESLWTTHTVRRGDTSGFAAPRWYQTNVTGGAVAANLLQAATWDPDGTNVIYRFSPSLAVNRNGDLALGYSTSSTSTKPAIKYAGRLAADPVNTFSQTETTLFQGAGTQVGDCGGAACARWGDYSAMSLDPDGCSFWYTNMYYAVDGLNHRTRVGAFAFPTCTPAGSGTLSGTVTRLSNGAPLVGATVALGSRTTVTNGAGNYSFSLPSGTYPGVTASYPGLNSVSFSAVTVNDSATTTRNFALPTGSTSGCFTDTSQADFQTGLSTQCDLNGTPGDVTLLDVPTVNQQNATLGTSGVGITVTTYGGQTFTPSVTAPLTRVDVNLFCSGCTGTTPDLTLSIRATSGGLPTGSDLVSATLTGFSSGSSAYYTATFASPITVTANTQYAFVVRPTANPSPGIYALTRSGTATVGSDVYAGGTRVSGATSGTVWSIPNTGVVTTDTGFKIYLKTGFPSSGTFTSSVKDANPVAGTTPTWATLIWNADTPANTGIQFQAAASTSPYGPFVFVGPDTTASTYFTSGASLAQFNGKRYMKYKAFFASSDAAASPSLHAVSVCFENVRAVTSLAVDAASGDYGSTVDLSATLTAASVGLAGKSVSFSLGGDSVGSATTNSLGVASLTSVSLAGITAGVHSGSVAAEFLGDEGYQESSGSNDLTVNAIKPGAPTIGVATAGNSRASVAFSAPASDGGSEILDYTATCGASNATAAASPISVTGLTNGVPVTCAVTARNAVGSGLPSEASNSVTPVAPSCLAGNFLANPTDETCTPASVGHYVPTNGATGELACPVGRYQDETGASSCKNARTGHYVSGTGASADVACSAGQYQSLEGQSSCTPASAGSYVPTPGATGQTACSAGSFQALTGQTSCTPASAGYYVPNSGAASQIACAPGTTSSPGATFCTVIPPTLSVSAGSVTEGNSGTKAMPFTITRNGASAVPVTVNWASASVNAAPGVVPATVAVDYRAASGVATIPAGPDGTSVIVNVLINGDTLNEDDEMLAVELSTPTGATLLTASAVGTIVNDDANPTLVIAGATVVEGSGVGTTPAVFKVTLSAATSRTVTVHWATSAGSATADVDYQSGSGDLTFLPGGALTQNVTVLVNQDVLGEANETFFVTLSAPTNATLGVASVGTGQINNDDGNASLRISGGLPTDATSITVTEGSPTTATAYLTKAMAVDVSFTWTLAPNGSGNSAASCADFAGGVCPTGSVTIPAGTIEVALPAVQVIADGLTEPDQLFKITLSNVLPSTGTFAVALERPTLLGKIPANNN